MGHECSECMFVASREVIFINPKLRKMANQRPIYVGTFTLPNWIGHLKFYLCLCSCGRAFVDYPHGYTEGGHLFFFCDNCNAVVIIQDIKIYEESGIERPSLFGDLWTILQLGFGRRKIMNRETARDC